MEPVYSVIHGPKIFGLIISACKPGSDEGLWAETSAIYINYQHLQITQKRIIVGTLAKRVESFGIDVAGTPSKIGLIIKEVARISRLI